jgi:sugar lactone lactonase YvrE
MLWQIGRRKFTFLAWSLILVQGLLAVTPGNLFAEEPTGELAQRLSTVEVTHYADAPGYSEGPIWRQGDLFFCSGALLRVGRDRKVKRFLDVSPAGTFLRENGDILICDNKNRALLNLSSDGNVGVIADKQGEHPLNSLNDLTVDPKGNVYWTDPAGSSAAKPVGSIYRVTPAGQVDKVAGGLAFPNGLEVDPAGKYLYVIESQTQRILRYDLPADNQPLGPATPFFNLGGAGGDGCAFDVDGNLWVADFHRKETGKGRITVVNPSGKALAHLNVPSKVVSNITFGGQDNNEIYCTTGEPPGVFQAKVGVKGFRGHPARELRISRKLGIRPDM